MQPYESHIPYLLQFTTDFNVQPMGWLHARTAMVRTVLCLCLRLCLCLCLCLLIRLLLRKFCIFTIV
jgi:hypothetical protein